MHVCRSNGGDTDSHPHLLRRALGRTLSRHNRPKCYLRRYLKPAASRADLGQILEIIGGCTRIRTLDPLIKSQLLDGLPDYIQFELPGELQSRAF